MTEIFIAVAAFLAALIYGYNRAVVLKNYVGEAFSTMDVYLKKRWDLLPNLIETVKSYTAHEKNLLTELTKIRSQSYEELSDSEKLNANLQIGQILPKIHAVAENYPDLKANQNYSLLMQQMEAIENDIANSRKYYNGTVREFNTFLEMFPTNLIGMIFHFQRAEMFEAQMVERENIKAEL
ncbi:MAG: LemA family protein [Alphaproteobacteria bacterium]|nr:LemA family protein [Alphaproteobacteria bacterium]